jgi:hypothetical protein
VAERKGKEWGRVGVGILMTAVSWLERWGTGSVKRKGT